MSGISYPFSETPESVACVTVVPGVKWLRMPLPIALDHINLYLIDCKDGWLVVDTGMKIKEIEENWEQIFNAELEGKPIKGVLATHMHPDHVGLAGWICERWQVPLYMSQLEYLHARCFSAMRPKELSWTTKQYFLRMGQNEEYLNYFHSRMGGIGLVMSVLPGGYYRLEAGQVLQLGDHRWSVWVGTGHSAEHVCLYCEDLGVLLSGDQVLPRISSNVSVLPIEPEANPLAGWLESHQRFLALPADTLVLPAHNLPFHGLHYRLRELITHHEDHMLALEEACLEPKNATELLPVLFKRELDISHLGMAVGECIAHLHLLMQRKRIERTLDEEGIFRFQSIDHTLSERVKIKRHCYVDDEPIMI